MPRVFLSSPLRFCGDWIEYCDGGEPKASSRRRPRSVSRKTSDNDVKKLLLFEEAPMYWREFSNFSRYCVAFPSEANAALGFLFTFGAKPKSKIRPIGQK